MVCADALAGADAEANALAAEVVDGRVNPGGVSGANPGVLDADDSSAVALVELESAPDADRDDAIEVEPAVAAVTLPFSSGTALDPLRRDDCPPRFEVPRPLAAAEPFPFDGSLRCANKPSKNAKRGCDGAICRSLSTSVRAPLKSSALSADSVCATRSTTSCEYCGA
jgi:hypothetical protein